MVGGIDVVPVAPKRLAEGDGRLTIPAAAPEHHSDSSIQLAVVRAEPARLAIGAQGFRDPPVVLERQPQARPGTRVIRAQIDCPAERKSRLGITPLLAQGARELDVDALSVRIA